jgi:hypothetical protein
MPKTGKRLTVGVLLKGSLADAMIAESEKTLAQYAAITRAALVEYFSKRGYAVEDDVSWGGYRERPQDEEQGQLVPAPVG